MRSRCTAALIMPRFSRVSATITLWWMRVRPSPRADAAMFCSWPCRLLTSVTFSCLSAMVLTRDLFEGLATLGRDLLGRTDLRQCVHGRAYHVDRIARAVALGEHVAHP